MKTLVESEINMSKEEQQLKIRKGSAFVHLLKPCVLGDGIEHVSAAEKDKYQKLVKKAILDRQNSFVKFVPASGAATRMFKHLSNSEPESELLQEFIEKLDRFAFWPQLRKLLQDRGFENLSAPFEFTSQQKAIVLRLLLDQEGMNLGNLPKALVPFHRFEAAVKTPIEEHVEEAVLIAGEHCSLHFTISVEHEQLFLHQKKKVLNKYPNVQIDYSFQDPNTNTLALNERDEVIYEKGEIKTFPAGHGALLQNLQSLSDYDVILIKNIDNIVHSSYLEEVSKEYNTLIGKLIGTRDWLYRAQEMVESGLDDEDLKKMAIEYSNLFGRQPNSTTENLREWLKINLNRPLRVCGMVKNEGKAGGGPFWVETVDSKTNEVFRSVQIIEKVQIDENSAKQNAILKNATHFNPVHIACSLKNYKGEEYNLSEFIDESGYLVTNKTKNGLSYKGLELPGLWNGAMAFWNTVFIEMPLTSFNPVKTVNDLLQPMHQVK